MNLLLVEDDTALGASLTNHLTNHRYTVTLATDGQTGLELAETYPYDLILLDMALPELNGIRVCQRLRAQGCEVPILLMTATDASSNEILGLDAGADDYVVKPFDVEVLVARVRALLRRRKSVTHEVMTWENVRFDPVAAEVTCDQKSLHLTPKEYSLLGLFLLNPKRVFSRSAILDRLWDLTTNPGEETVSTHIKCLRQKLKKAGAADPVETVYGLGYRLKSPKAVVTTPLISNTAANTIASKPAATVINTTSTAPTTSTTPTTINQQVSPDLDYSRRVIERTVKIWEKFQSKFVEQVRVLQDAASALTTNQLTTELQQQAQHVAHKLAGSLGIFGFTEGSQIAKELEEWLQLQTGLESSQVSYITDRVEQLQQILQQQPSLASRPTSTHLTSISDMPWVLLVDDDTVLTEQIKVEAIAWGLRVEVAPNPEVARQAIAHSPPQAILLDLNFPGDESGFVLLRELMQRVPKIPVLVFTGQGTLSDRLEVARLGECIFLQKPLPTYTILKAVAETLRHQIDHFNRVLVVDDEAAIIAKVASLLQPLGVEVVGVEHPQQFWDVLTTTPPNLLLLDLEMPDIHGIELCQTVRSDPQWQQLPILFLSAHTTVPNLDRAFMAGADDYLDKAMTDQELITRIIHRLRRGSSYSNNPVAEDGVQG